MANEQDSLARRLRKPNSLISHGRRDHYGARIHEDLRYPGREETVVVVDDSYAEHFIIRARRRRRLIGHLNVLARQSKIAAGCASRFRGLVIQNTIGDLLAGPVPRPDYTPAHRGPHAFDH